METITNSAGGIAAVAMALNLARASSMDDFCQMAPPLIITVRLTGSKSLTIIVSPLDMMGLIGIAQVLGTLAYGIKGLRRRVSTWDWPSFDENPQ